MSLLSSGQTKRNEGQNEQFDLGRTPHGDPHGDSFVDFCLRVFSYNREWNS
jgi:hypothetical protein